MPVTDACSPIDARTIDSVIVEHDAGRGLGTEPRRTGPCLITYAPRGYGWEGASARSASVVMRR